MDVNVADADGNTALMCAARGNHPQVVRKFLLSFYRALLSVAELYLIAGTVNEGDGPK